MVDIAGFKLQGLLRQGSRTADLSSSAALGFWALWVLHFAAKKRGFGLRLSRKRHSKSRGAAQRRTPPRAPNPISRADVASELPAHRNRNAFACVWRIINNMPANFVNMTWQL